MNLFHMRALAYFAYSDLPDETLINHSVSEAALQLIQTQSDEHLSEMTKGIYQQIIIKDYRNENKTNGLVVYQFQYRDEQLIVFRGSESYKVGSEADGWQDWEDNFDTILNQNTLQEKAATRYVNMLQITGRITMCGHSKGGKLAVYCALTCREEIFQAMERLIAFNAPGIMPEVRKQYQQRIKDMHQRSMVTLMNNEYDVVSALFYAIEKPQFIESKIKGDSLENVLKAHGLYEYAEDGRRFIPAKGRSKIAKEVHFLFNDVLLRLPLQERRVLTLPIFAYFALDTPLESITRYVISMISSNTSMLKVLKQEQNQGMITHAKKTVKLSHPNEDHQTELVNQIFHEFY